MNRKTRTLYSRHGALKRAEEAYLEALKAAFPLNQITSYKHGKHSRDVKIREFKGTKARVENIYTGREYWIDSDRLWM